MSQFYRGDINDDMLPLKKRCVRQHQIAILTWVFASLIVVLALFILANTADRLFDINLTYYRQIKMFILAVVALAFFIVASKKIYRISSKEWTDYLTDKQYAIHEKRMNETCPTCNAPPAPSEVIDRIYFDEAVIDLIADASVDSGIIMVGGQVQVGTLQSDISHTPENILSQMLIKRIAAAQFFDEEAIVYIDLYTEEKAGRDISTIVTETLARNNSPHLLFIIDRFYYKGSLDAALMLSKKGHTVIGISHPSQSPRLSKILHNSLAFVDGDKADAALTFLKEVNLMVMRDSASTYRSLDLHPKTTLKLINVLQKAGLGQVYPHMETLTTTPQTPPPLRP